MLKKLFALLPALAGHTNAIHRLEERCNAALLQTVDGVRVVVLSPDTGEVIHIFEGEYPVPGWMPTNSNATIGDLGDIMKRVLRDRYHYHQVATRLRVSPTRYLTYRAWPILNPKTLDVSFMRIIGERETILVEKFEVCEPDEKVLPENVGVGPLDRDTTTIRFFMVVHGRSDLQDAGLWVHPIRAELANVYNGEHMLTIQPGFVNHNTTIADLVWIAKYYLHDHFQRVSAEQVSDRAGRMAALPGAGRMAGLDDLDISFRRVEDRAGRASSDVSAPAETVLLPAERGEQDQDQQVAVAGEELQEDHHHDTTTIIRFAMVGAIVSGVRPRTGGPSAWTLLSGGEHPPPTSGHSTWSGPRQRLPPPLSSLLSNCPRLPHQLPCPHSSPTVLANLDLQHYTSISKDDM